MSDNPAEVVFIIVSILSVIGCLSVLLTWAIIPQLRTRYFMHIIVMIAFSNLFVSIAGTFGFPPSNSQSCAVQGFFIAFFLRANWGWTTVISYKLYSFAMTEKLIMEYRVMHSLVWGCALVVALLPLTTGTYGRSEPTRDSFCFTDQSSETWRTVWDMVVFVAYLFFCLAFMSVCFLRIYGKYRLNYGLKSNVFVIVSTLYVYPFILLITWMPNVVMSNFVRHVGGIPESSQNTVVAISQIIGIANGFLLGIVFFFKSPEARRRWRNIFLLWKWTATNELEADLINRLEVALTVGPHITSQASSSTLKDAAASNDISSQFSAQSLVISQLSQNSGFGSSFNSHSNDL